jgi:hypothetical protein
VRKQNQRHGVVLVTVEYAATDNCSAVTAELSVTGRDGSSRGAQVIDAHHLLLKNGRSDEDDDDDGGRGYVMTILVTDEAGNHSVQTLAIGGRRAER